MTTSRTSINAWAKLNWRDPMVTLAELRALEIALSGSDVSDRVRRLRDGDLKPVREGRDAALFALGMANATGHKVYFAPFEGADYDFVTSWVDRAERLYCPVQLKEVPPSDLAPHESLGKLLASLKTKYGPTDTVLAVLLNQPSELTIAEVAAASVPFSQVWLFWCASPDQQRWAIQGDILSSPACYEFEYPTPEVAA